MEATIGIEPMHKGFADPCLTTWLRGQRLTIMVERVTGVEPVSRPWQGRIIAAIRYPRISYWHYYAIKYCLTCKDNLNMP